MRSVDTPRDVRNLGEGLERRLAAYGGMALAAALGGANPAEAGIISFTGVNASNTTSTPLAFNLQTGAVGSDETNMDFAFRFFGNPSSSSLALVAALTSGRGVLVDPCFCSSFASKLLAGSLIGPAGNFNLAGFLAYRSRYSSTPTTTTTTPTSTSDRAVARPDTYTGGNWLPGAQPGFLGLRFTIGPNTYYGWANLVVNPDLTVTLDSFAYEACADQAIEAGQTSGGASCDAGGETPEPHSAVLLALGAAGIAAYRRRRKAAA